MLFDYLADKPWLHLWIICCGILVTVCLICALGILLLEILKGFVLAIDFHRFKRKCATYRNRTHKFRLRWFLNSWAHFIGWGTNGSLTSIDGDQYLGYGRWIIRGKFTTVVSTQQVDPEDLEDDDELELPDDSFTDKRP
jgi:hypothetical protein|uniref:Uncharacterized protein n=1 Tax=Myoviridae sp. ctshb19 TaxID=2825194 RepID=A0A8S5UGG9_9CAUD|nr:MAG TPA: hypothetical protein [Myoviridae sp. ctshb19]